MFGVKKKNGKKKNITIKENVIILNAQSANELQKKFNVIFQLCKAQNACVWFGF